MEIYYFLIALCALIVLSYFFSFLSEYTRVPQILFLLGTGVILRQIIDKIGWHSQGLDFYVHFLGVVGLILIVLEGALDIHMRRDSALVMRKAFDAAVCIFLLTSAAVAALFRFCLGSGWYVSLINAFPFGVISSAIIIPSIGYLAENKKEFLVYESVFSDICGILFFTTAISTPVFSASLVADAVFQTTITVLIAIFSSIVMILFVVGTRHNVKVFIMLAVIVLMYCAGKLLNLSPLLVVFVFGLFLANPAVAFEARVIADRRDIFDEELRKFKAVVGESSFVVRTFFFVVFGYSLSLSAMFDFKVLMLGFLSVVVVYLIRYVYLKFVSRTDIVPELFAAPRGLVSILLFYTIPSGLLITGVSRGVLFFVVVATSLVMTVAVIADSITQELKKEEEEARLKAAARPGRQS